MISKSLERKDKRQKWKCASAGDWQCLCLDGGSSVAWLSSPSASPLSSICLISLCFWWISLDNGFLDVYLFLTGILYHWLFLLTYLVNILIRDAKSVRCGRYSCAFLSKAVLIFGACTDRNRNREHCSDRSVLSIYLPIQYSNWI